MVVDSDAAAARLRAALDHAAVGVPAAAPVAAADKVEHYDLHSAMLLHEAAAVLNLHAQAVSIQNIRSVDTEFW